ncbi:MAG: Diphthine synthase [Methanosaeta sp. PtaU1.Bin060]|jgi:diphthine synthase|nr:MAG: Diphthine synthase [Methanosaeta sp. PtaU1.Bin060]
MLVFIGLGLYDEKDISVKGLEQLLAADEIYAEFYTSRLMGSSHEKLESFFGRQIRLLSREDVEGDPIWLEEAREKVVAFLVGGDPMVSTTHLDLRLRALDMGIETKVIHSSSIVTAASGLTGLQNYRFGRSATIPFPYVSRGRRIVSQTPYTVLKENLQRNLHTMLFLDIQNERFMTVNEGASLLMEMQDESGEKLLLGRLGIGIARAGSEDSVVKADLLSRLALYDFGGPLHILIVPASLHFMEAKALVALAGAPPETLKGDE